MFRKQRRMRGGWSISDIGSTLKNAISDLQDTPQHFYTKMGNGVAAGSEYLSKWTHNSPITPELPSRLVDDIMGNSRAHRSDSDVFSHLKHLK